MADFSVWVAHSFSFAHDRLVRRLLRKRGPVKYPKLVPELEPKAAAVQLGLYAGPEQAIRPAHHAPVVLVGGSTSQADLIVPAIVVNARPREAVRAPLAQKKLQQFHGFT